MSISSLAASPSQAYSGSLLNPPNPSFAPIDGVPRGGILLNSRRGSDSPQARPSALPLLSTDSSPGLSVRPGFESPNEPSTPVHEDPPSAPHLALAPSSPLVSPTESFSGHPPRIRFAPLPDPRRPRSLSTGRNVVWKPTEGPSGETTRTVEIRGVSAEVEFGEEEDEASDDEDEFARRKSEGEDEDDEKRGRRWSKTMGSWGKGTKKLLGLKDDEGYSEGAPLKKSVSTGGFIGTSPFRWTSETERKANMQGLAPSSPFARNDHRRNSSMENPTGSPLSSSPQPVRMLNGRVYGSRRLMEAAEREKEWREKNEPAFIEWGHGKQGAGLGSNQAHKLGGGFLGDAEEGSGMEWVKRRREERQKRAEEERRQAEGARARSDSGASEGDPGGTNDDDTPSKSERQTPIIQVSEHLSPLVRKPTDPWKPSAQAVPIAFNPTPSSGPGILSKSAPVTMEAEKDHVTEAIQVPAHKREDGGGRGVDIFGDGKQTKGRRQSGASSRSGGSRSSRSSVLSEAKDLHEQVLEDDEDSEDDGDPSYDEDDEEEDVPMPRTTSSAAGVEKVSRHKD